MDQTVVLCTLAAFFLYYNTLYADFAYDDSRAIKTNPDVNPSTPWINVLFNDFWGTPLTHTGSHKSYRPLCVFSFRFNHWLHELQPVGYHLLNVLLHCAATSLFTVLARSLLPPRAELATAVAGGLFASHPVHTEAVAGIVGRADLGAAVFFILAFLSYREYASLRSCLFNLRQLQLQLIGGQTSLVQEHANQHHKTTNSFSNNNRSNYFLSTNRASNLPDITPYACRTTDGSCQAAGAQLTFPIGSSGTRRQCFYCATFLATKKWFWLFLTVIFATCSMLTKEHGVTVLAVCAVYDFFVHSRLRLRDIFSRIIFQKKNRGLVEGLSTLIFSTVFLVIIRLQLMGSKAPEFSPADNPSADSSEHLTRSLTFLYLPAFNLWLLVQPAVLSFDWSMEAIPLIQSLVDVRNVITFVFYFTLSYVGWNYFVRRRHVDVSSESDESRELPTTSESPQFNSLATPTTCHHALISSVPLASSSSTSIPASGCNSNTMARVRNSYSSSFVLSCINATGNTSASNSNWCYSTSSSLSVEQISGRSSCSSVNMSGTNRNDANRGYLDLTVIAVSILVLPFIPATNLFFYVGFVVAERILYIPSMGYCLLVASGFHLIEEGLRRRGWGIRGRRGKTDPIVKLASWLRPTFRWGLFVLFLLYSLRTIRRNQDWLTEESLYKSGISINPPKAYGNLANILSAAGHKDKAEWAYKKALSYRNNMADVHYNLGILYQEQKRYEESIQYYRTAIIYRPRMAMAHLNLGLVLTLLGLKDEAIEVYRHCSQLDGTGLKDPRTHETTKISALFNLGRLYADDGHFARAIQVYNEAIKRMPSYYQPQSLYNMLGEAHFKLERLKDAEYWYREALRVKADHIPAHLTYGKLLAKMKRTNEAEEIFLRARALAPNDSTVYQHYGQFLSECERHSEAAEQYLQASVLMPTDYEIVFNAANTLRQAGKHLEAELHYRTAVNLRPLDATSHMNLGAMLHVNGKLMEAEQSYLEALRLKPDDQITQTNLQKLRHLLMKKGKTSSV